MKKKAETCGRNSEQSSGRENQGRSQKVIVVLAEGFEEMEAVISIDMLARAGLDVKTAALTSRLLVRGAHGIAMQADMKLGKADVSADALVLPGGMPGTENLAASETVIELVKGFDQAGKIIAAICAAPAYVLAKAGVLSRKKAACYPGCEDRFAKDVIYVNEPVVVDGNIITSQGPGTAFIFALEIITRLLGAETAAQVKEKALVR